MPDGMSEYMSVRMPVIMSEYVSGNHSKKVMFVVCHMLIETGYIYIIYNYITYITCTYHTTCRYV